MCYKPLCGGPTTCSSEAKPGHKSNNITACHHSAVAATCWCAAWRCSRCWGRRQSRWLLWSRATNHQHLLVGFQISFYIQTFHVAYLFVQTLNKWQNNAIAIAFYAHSRHASVMQNNTSRCVQGSGAAAWRHCLCCNHHCHLCETDPLPLEAQHNVHQRRWVRLCAIMSLVCYKLTHRHSAVVNTVPIILLCTSL